MGIEDLSKRELNDYNPYSDSNAIVWTADRKLQWQDYLGQPDQSSKFEALSNIVTFRKADPKIIANSSEFEIVNIVIVTLFRKSFSWVKPHATQNPHQGILLQHEQTHFNIEEFFSRKFAKKFQEYASKRYRCEGNTLKEQEIYADKEIEKILVKIEQEIKPERDWFNETYEKETNYSMNIKNQGKYNLLVAKMLK